MSQNGGDGPLSLVLLAQFFHQGLQVARYLRVVRFQALTQPFANLTADLTCVFLVCKMAVHGSPNLLLL
jgi:hypothetical protein